MNCAYHPEIQADAYCRTCGKALCTACKRDVKGVVYCEDCIAARVVDTIPAAVPVSGTKVPGQPSPPSPAVATMLGFIPGVGAMYNGQFGKAFAHILIFASLVFADSHLHGGAEPFFGIATGGFYIYMIFDAYKTARAKLYGEPLPDPFGLNSLFGDNTATASAPVATAPVAGFAPVNDPAAATGGYVAPSYAPPPYVAAPVERRVHAPVGAFILIGLGVIFLLNNIGLFGFGVLGRLWPLALIGLGCWIFFNRRSSCACQRCSTRGLMGPAVLVTLGTMFLLDSFGVVSFDRLLPLLLIVIGGVLLLRQRSTTEGHVAPVMPVAPPSTLPPTEPTAPSTSNSEVTNV